MIVLPPKVAWHVRGYLRQLPEAIVPYHKVLDLCINGR